MKLNQWTLALAAGGVVSLGSVVMAEEAQHQVQTALSSTTLSGYVDTSAIYQFGIGKTATGRSYDGVNKQNGFNSSNRPACSSSGAYFLSPSCVGQGSRIFRPQQCRVVECGDFRNHPRCLRLSSLSWAAIENDRQ